MVTAAVTGSNRGLGLGFIRQLLLRPKYDRIIAIARTFDPGCELDKLRVESEGRVQVARLRDVSDVEACQECADEIRQLSPSGVNVLVNNAGHATQPKPMTPLDLTTVEGAVDYRKTWSINAFGPLLISTTLLNNKLLVGYPHSSSSSSAGNQAEKSHMPRRPILETPTNRGDSSESANPESDEEKGLDGKFVADTVIKPAHLPPNWQPPIIVNITSGQASLTRANEIWEGGLPRDELYFHPVYAASKAALSGVTMHMSRILRNHVIVGQVHPGWLKTTMGRSYADFTPDEASSRVLDIIETWKNLDQSGQYLDNKGQKLPW